MVARLFEVAGQVRAQGKQVMVSLAPSEAQVVAAFRNEVAEKYDLDLEQYDLTLPARVIEGIRDRVAPDVVIVNLVEYFQCESERNPEALYPRFDTHWSKEGNDLAGRVLAFHALSHWFDREPTIDEHLAACVVSLREQSSPAVSAVEIEAFVSEIVAGEPAQGPDRAAEGVRRPPAYDRSHG
jgi:hypothetical protein